MTKDAVRAEIEEAIRRDPNDPAAYLVLADLLQTTGDPRGELISVQETLANMPTDRLRELEEDMLERFQEALLGPLDAAIAALGVLPGRQMVGLAWRRGFLRKVTVRVRDRGDELVELARALVASPAAAFLEAFEASLLTWEDEPLADIVKALGGLPPTTMRELHLRTAGGGYDVGALVARLPQLRSLVVSNEDETLTVGKLALPGLERLELNEVAIPDARALLAAPPPKLARLDLAFDDNAGDLAARLAGGAIPKLAHLGCRSAYEDIDVPSFQLGTTESLRLEPVTVQTLTALMKSGKKLRALDLGFADDVEMRDLRPLLAGGLPNLRRLTLGNVEYRHDVAEIAAALKLPKLECLALREADDSDLDEIVDSRKRLAKIPRIELVDSELLERGWRKHEVDAARKKLPNLRLVPSW